MTGSPTDDWRYGSQLPSQPSLGDGSWRSRALAGQLSAGAWLGRRFRVLGLLGRGGMGVVYRAHDPVAGRDVALKVVARQLNPRQLERFRREGELTARLSHPGIVGIHEAGELEGIPYLAYELVEGGRSLEDAFADRGTEVAQRVEWIAQTAEALAHAHERGIIHRDVKPANVLLDQQGQARVADFGLALGQDATRMTQSGAMVGTPTYMAPEQVSARRDLTPAADVWSVGVMLYEALCRELPFQGATLMELAGNICEGTPRAPRELEPTIPRPLEAVCLQCLTRDPLRRYPDAGALAADLRRAMAGQAVNASTLRQRWIYGLRQSRQVRLAAGLALGATLATAAGVALAIGLRDPAATAREQLRAVEAAVRGGADPAPLVSLLAQAEAEHGAQPWLTAGHLLLAGADRLPPDRRLEHVERALALGGAAVADEVVERHLEEGRYARAADVLAGKPADGSLQGLLRLGELELLAGRWDQAQAVADRLAQEHPRDGLAQRFQVRVALERGDPQRARALLDAIPEAQGGVGKRVLEGRVAAAMGGDGLETLELTARDTVNAPREVRRGERREVLAAYLALGEIRAAAAWAVEWDLARGAQPEDERLLGLLALLQGARDDLGPLMSAPPALRRAAVRWLLAEGQREACFAIHPRREAWAQGYKRSDHDPQAWVRGARRVLGLVVRAAPSSPEALEASLTLAELARAQGEDAGQHVAAAAALAPEDPRVRLAAAWEALGAGALDAAIARLPEPTALPEPAPGHRDLRASTAELAGRVGLARGEVDRALALLREAFEPARADAGLGAALADALTRAGEDEAAADVTERVRRLRGERWREAAERYGEARGPMKNAPHSARLVVLEEALALDPNLGQAMFLKAKLIGREGELEEAMRIFAHSTSRQPYLHAREMATVLRDMTMNGVTLALGGESATNLAVIRDRIAATRRPGDDLVLGMMDGAVVEFERGGRDAELAGLRELDHTLARHPGEWLAWHLRGFLHLRRGHLVQARRDLELAAQVAPDASLFYLALLAAKQGRPAAEVLEALEAGPAYGFPRMTLAELGVYPELEPYLRTTPFKDALLELGWR